METAPASGALAWNALVEVTGHTKEELVELGFTDDYAIRLEKEGYIAAALLKAATQESLEKFGLKHAQARYVYVCSKAAAAAQPPATQPVDISGHLVTQMLKDMPPIMHLPKSAAELKTLLLSTGPSHLRIPIPITTHNSLQSQLDSSRFQLLRAVDGYHYASATFAALITKLPYDHGSEMTTTCAITYFLSNTFDILNALSGITLSPTVILNRTEQGAGSLSGVVPGQSRPDTLVVHDHSTVMIGEDKDNGKLHDAIRDLQGYAKGGLGAVQYGTIPGIIAYAAAGMELQFCFISKAGEVGCVGHALDLSSTMGRLDAVCAIIQCYRIMAMMSECLPPKEMRVTLWKVVERGPGTVMLTPSGASKAINKFENHARATGASEAVLKGAYRAASQAAAKQQQEGKQPFLVYASSGPSFGRRYTVCTTPLGYHRTVSTEQDARHVAWACVQAASVLHAADIVHTDFRLQNVVWLADDHCMVIDLELCRSATAPLPSNFSRLHDWTDHTLEVKGGESYFTTASDLYQIGVMLQRLLQQSWSQHAHAFVAMLISKRLPASQGAQALTAEAAMCHEWFKGMQGKHG